MQYQITAELPAKSCVSSVNFDQQQSSAWSGLVTQEQILCEAGLNEHLQLPTILDILLSRIEYLFFFFFLTEPRLKASIWISISFLSPPEADVSTLFLFPVFPHEIYGPTGTWNVTQHFQQHLQLHSLISLDPAQTKTLSHLHRDLCTVFRAFQVWGFIFYPLHNHKSRGNCNWQMLSLWSANRFLNNMCASAQG